MNGWGWGDPPDRRDAPESRAIATACITVIGVVLWIAIIVAAVRAL